MIITFLYFSRSLKTLIGATMASFLMTNGLNNFSKSVFEDEGSCFIAGLEKDCPEFKSLLLMALGFFKKADMSERDFV